MPTRTKGCGPNPTGVCWCGCGQRTAVAKTSRVSTGDVLGTPNRFVLGHKPKPPEYAVDQTTGCWVWQRAIGTHGYGVLTVANQSRLAHRWFYERTIGAIPDGLDLDHLCGNRACVNPDHLEPVTRSENMLRAYARLRGES